MMLINPHSIDDEDELENILEECVNGTRFKQWHQPYD